MTKTLFAKCLVWHLLASRWFYMCHKFFILLILFYFNWFFYFGHLLDVTNFELKLIEFDLECFECNKAYLLKKQNLVIMGLETSTSIFETLMASSILASSPVTIFALFNVLNPIAPYSNSLVMSPFLRMKIFAMSLTHPMLS